MKLQNVPPPVMHAKIMEWGVWLMLKTHCVFISPCPGSRRKVGTDGVVRQQESAIGRWATGSGAVGHFASRLGLPQVGLFRAGMTKGATRSLWVLAAVLALAIFPDRVHGKTHIVVPCYNEEARLPRQKFLDFTSGTENADVVFTLVNDGSSDDTMRVIEEMSQLRPGRIYGLDLGANGGKAEAVRKGMLHVIGRSGLGQGDSVGFWDADLATPLGTIPEFVQVLEKRADIEMVFGARVALLGRDIRRKADRHYLGRIFATLASISLSLPIYDTQCGAKLFRATKDLETALSQPFTSGWIFDIELLARFIRQKASVPSGSPCEHVIYEYPLEQWHDVPGSKLGFMSKINALYGLANIWVTYFSPYYAAVWPPAPSSAQGHSEL